MTSNPPPQPPANPGPPRRLTAGGLISVVTGGTADYVGSVNGAVTIETTVHRFWGGRVLSACGVLVLAVFVAQLVLTGATLLSALILPVAVLVCLLLIYRLMLGPWVGRVMGAAARGVGSLAVSAARTLAGSAASNARRIGTTPADQPLTVRRFQVRAVTGEIVTCVLLGELIGHDLRSGDIVRVTGRTRRGQCVVREAVLMSSPVGPVVRRVRARPTGSYLFARWASRLGYGLAVLLLVWTAAHLLGALR